jgi:dsRNA-specific ribonuclease
MGLARVCPAAAHDRSTAPFEAFVGAYYTDQHAAATGIRDALPITTTVPHSPLHSLFHTYSPEAQAVAAVDALVAAVLDRCWRRFFRVDAVTAVELRSLVHTAGGDPKAALNARFHVRFHSAPVWEYGMTQTGQHTCTVRHLDGVVLGMGEGATREEAERWAAEGVGVV